MSDVACQTNGTREQFKSALLEFINVRLPELRELKNRPDVDGATPLFEGVIDSLGILHLIAFVEKGTGRKIPTKMVTMDRFRTVDAICESFWSDSEEVPR